MTPAQPNRELPPTKINILFVPVAPKEFSVRQLVTGPSHDACGPVIPALLAVAAHRAKPVTPLLAMPAEARRFAASPAKVDSMSSSQNLPQAACGWTFTIRK